MPTILVVDDEPTVLKLCETVLRRGGYDTLTASSGDEALRLIESEYNRIDCAVLDVMMPGMNGIELANRIRQPDRSIRIVLMSGYSPREILPLISSHPYRVIWKPFKAESLLQMVENAIWSTKVRVLRNTARWFGWQRMGKVRQLSWRQFLHGAPLPRAI